MNRRDFTQLSAGAILAAALNRSHGEEAQPRISAHDSDVKVHGKNYSWTYSSVHDSFALHDLQGRSMATGPVQPAIFVSPADKPSSRRCIRGRPVGHQIDGNRVRFKYEDGGGPTRVSITWRFDANGIWVEPVVYRTTESQNIVSLQYFAEADEASAIPALRASFIIAPGISEGTTISPIVPADANLDRTFWLGHGSFDDRPLQQWALPVHFFSGFSIDPPGVGMHDEYSQGMSDAFTCGLADLPPGDLFLRLLGGRSSLCIDYRSDLWKHLRGPGQLKLGSTLLWAVGNNYHEAIAGYYNGLANAGIIRRKSNSARKTASMLAPQFCTWGAQAGWGKAGQKLDEAFLNALYGRFRNSGMKAGMFSIDEGWEGSYGTLEHSTTRLPHFEEFLSRLRADGYRVGLWTALMRCEDPADLGLTMDNMLKGPDGRPYRPPTDNSRYFVLDFTQPRVAKVLTETARKFIRRYKPDLVKFDYGYELPSVAKGAPEDKAWAGERLMWKGLDVVIRAMKEENPDLVVMYYQLSPLLLDYIDLHSIDDLFLAAGEYDLEANRRMFFSSLLGQLGVPTYGSSGYDWASSPEIWFDSAAVGTVGSLNSFLADQQGLVSTPEDIAKYNGMAKVLRNSTIFTVVPLDVVYEAPTRGAHARSWARFEDGQLVLLALRPGPRNPLASPARIRALKHSVVADMPVVVSSRGTQAIARSSNLAVAPLGRGNLTIRREHGSHAEVISHYFGGAVTNNRLSIDHGELRLTVKATHKGEAPLEWMELHIS